MRTQNRTMLTETTFYNIIKTIEHITFHITDRALTDSVSLRSYYYRTTYQDSVQCLHYTNHLLTYLLTELSSPLAVKVLKSC